MSSSMKRITGPVRAMLLAAVLALPPGIAVASEKQQAAEQWIHDGLQNALMGRDIAWLEKTNAAYRKDKTRLPNGLWALNYFYAQIGDLCAMEPTEDLPQWLNGIFEAWKSEYPQSPGPLIATAACRIGMAGAIRGHGYASEVWEDSWAPMNRIYEKALDQLERDKPIAAQDPHWFLVKATAHHVQGAPDRVFWANVEEGLAAEPLYYGLYVVGFNRSLPRWGGSFEQTEQWARRAVERTRSRLGDAMYAFLATKLQGIHTYDEMFDDFGVDQGLLKQGMLDFIAIQQTPVIEYVDRFTEMNCAMKDFEHARIIWEKGRESVPEWPAFDRAKQCQLISAGMDGRR